MTRSLSRLGAVVALSIAWLSGAHARTDCPPVPQPPTQEQLAEGFRTAKDRGAMWTLTKDGRTSYLYGTLHVGRMAWAFPGPKLLQALRDTQGNRADAARRLGMSRAALYDRLSRWPELLKDD